MSDLLRCPSCDAPLRPRDDLPPGADVRCPKCGTEFQAPAEVGVQSPSSPGLPEAPPPEPPPYRRGDEIAEDREYSRKFMRPESEGEVDRTRDRDRDRGWEADEDREYDDDRDWRQRFRRDEYDDREPPREGRTGPLSNNYPMNVGQWLSTAWQYYGDFLSIAAGFVAVYVCIQFGMACLNYLAYLGQIVNLFLDPALFGGLYIAAHRHLRRRPVEFGTFWQGFRGEYYRRLVWNNFLCHLVYAPFFLLNLANLVLTVVNQVAVIQQVQNMQATSNPGPPVFNPPIPDVVITGISCGGYVFALLGAVFYVRMALFSFHLIIDRGYGAVDAIKGSWELTAGQHWLTALLVGLLYCILYGVGAMLCLFGLILSLPLVVLFTSAMYFEAAGVGGTARRRTEEDEL